MKKDFLTIITPYYNSLNCIQKLLDSLANQTFQNFELIIIDDYSNKKDYNGLKKLMKNYSFNIKLYRNSKNFGPGYTRNYGIKEAKTPYVTFIDADDYVSNDFVEKIFKVLNEKNYDCLIFDYNIEKKYYGYVVKSLPLKESEPKAIDVLALSNGMCWGKVYKKRIIDKKNIIFPNLMRSEDLAFVKVYLSKCKTIYYLQEPLYNYVQNNNSIMHNAKTLKIDNNKKAYEYIDKNVKKSKAKEMIYLREYIYLIIQNMFRCHYEEKDILLFLEQENLNNDIFKNKYIKYQPLYLRYCLFLIEERKLSILKYIFKLKK